ncbi:hypothetical protein [Engelhardtia mirabilis]|uniref:Uncharacterized protein n=1 Tax=Engelhardtia mirabilis TaxID=2528011 RepID=A0A518BGR4_9BACT|nr:hypothetical protein Pla133_12120 [Planctomycetes bacterium Pla133]QDV00473.1 hypothetical protein Pla86_12120 [Planctomycetes bacterium Pla86]
MRSATTSTLLIALTLSISAPAASALQKSFDYITFDRIDLDPNFALQTSTRWGIVVNTGTEPLSLTDDWEGGLWYGESSQLLGSFFFELLDPFGAGLTLQPGEAAGDADPLLLAQLLPGETFVTAALIAPIQFGVPFPTSDFHLDLHAQVGDLIAKTRTDVTLKDLGGSAFWTPTSAKRVSGAPSPISSSAYGAACAGPSGSATLTPYGSNGGPGGPPWVALRSNLPQIGNWAFGYQIVSPTFNASYALGIDIAPGSIPLAGCSLLLGFTPALSVLFGQIPNFQQTHNIPIPNDPVLIGVTIYAQAVLLPPQFVTTNGISITIGDVQI